MLTIENNEVTIRTDVNIANSLAARFLWNAAKHCLKEWNLHFALEFGAFYLEAFLFLKQQARMLDPEFKEIQ